MHTTSLPSRAATALTCIFILAASNFLIRPGKSFAASRADFILSEGNHAALVGPVSSASVDEVERAILSSDESSPLLLYIDSPGGSVFDGLDLVQTMQASGRRIICVANQAISMAFYIFLACDERYITPNAILMQHVSSYAISGEEPNNYTKSRLLRRVSKAMDHEQAKRLNMTYAEFRKKIRDDWWIFGTEAISVGAASGVRSVSCDRKLVSAKKTILVPVLFGSESRSVSACPLLQSDR